MALWGVKDVLLVNPASGSPPSTVTSNVLFGALVPSLAATTPGSLPAGTYSYVVTAIVGGVEGAPSAEVTITLAGTGLVANVVLTWPTVFGATGYRIYRSTVSNTVFNYGQTGAPLTTGTGITSIPLLSPLVVAIPVGAVALGYTDSMGVQHGQVFTTSGAAVGAMSILLTSSQAPTYSFPMGTQIAKATTLYGTTTAITSPSSLSLVPLAAPLTQQVPPGPVVLVGANVANTQQTLQTTGANIGASSIPMSGSPTAASNYAAGSTIAPIYGTTSAVITSLSTIVSLSLAAGLTVPLAAGSAIILLSAAGTSQQVLTVGIGGAAVGAMSIPIASSPTANATYGIGSIVGSGPVYAAVTIPPPTVYGVTSAALSPSGGPITGIALTASTPSVASGNVTVLASDGTGYQQSFSTPGSGSPVTTIPVSSGPLSPVPDYAYPAGSQVVSSGTVTWTDTNAASTNVGVIPPLPPSTPPFDCSQFSYLWFSADAAAGGQVSIQSRYYSDPAGAHNIFDGQIVIDGQDPGDNFPMQLAALNKGPYGKINLLFGGQPFVPHITGLLSNTPFPVGLYPGSPVLAVGAIVLPASTTTPVIKYFGQFFDGPVGVELNGGSQGATFSFQYLANGIPFTYYEFFFASLTAGQITYQTVTFPMAACRAVVLNASSTTANSTAQIVAVAPER